MLIVALMVLSTVLAVVISAAPTAAAAPVGGTAGAPVAAVPSGAPAAPTASGTITSELATFAADIAATAGPTVTDAVSGGTFGSGSVVYFYISSSNGCTGIPAGGPVGHYDLAGGATTLSDNHVAITPLAGTGSATVPAAGANYLVASDTSSTSAGCATGAQYTGGAAITTVGVAALADAPTVLISGTGQPGTTEAVSASNFDGGATVSVYFSNGDGTALSTQLLTSFTTTSGGSAPASASFTVPTVGLDTYSIFAIETSPSTSSAASPFGGVSADTTITIAPIITVSPISFSGAASSALTISGEGFTAGDTIASAPGPAGSSDISIYTQGASPTLLTGTVHGAVTVSSTGTFTVSVTTVTAIPIANSGAEAVHITTAVTTYTFRSAVFVSVPNPTELGFVFDVTPVTLSSGSHDVVGSPVTAYVYNFPADSTVTIAFGPASFPAITTDANGYGALSSTAVIPAVSGGSYVPTAMAPLAGLFAAASPVTVTPYFAVYDGSGNLLTSAFAEYFPGTGVYTVAGFGLTPSTHYAPTDSGAGAGAGIVAVIVGASNSAGSAVYPAVNGTAVFTYTPAYVTATTGAAQTITFTGVATLTAALGYLQVGAVAITTPAAFAIYTSGGTETLAIGNLVPFGSQVYAGVVDSYNAYFGTAILSFGSPPSSTINAETAAPPGTTGCSVTTGAGACSLSYTVPTLSNGVYSVAITSAGGSVANALATQYVVVSTAGSSVTGGSLILVLNTEATGYTAVGVGLDSAASPVTLGWAEYTGVVTASETLTDGAFVDTTHLAAILTTTEPAGNYQILVEQSTASATGFIYPTPSTYTISAALTLTGNDPGTCTSTTVSCGGIDSTASFTASGLMPSGYYDLYFNGAVATLAGVPVTQVQAGLSGSIGSTSFTVPTLMPGFYNVSLDISGTTMVAASASFEVAEGSSFTLTSGGTDAASAFPGELVSFAWTPGTAPAAGSPVEVTVLLNGTAYTTEPAAVSGTMLMGSFLMPNSVPGTYFALTLEWTQTVVTVTGGTGGSTTTSYTSVGANFAQLVSGNGALLTGVTPGQIAEITTAVNNTLKVPIAELNAAVTSINGAVVKITTAFGNMTTTLNAINATLTSVAGTVATIETSIGTITTSLSTISAQITSVNGVVTSMNGTLSVVAGNVVSIQTSVGTISGTVTSISGGIATVQTSLGNLSVAVSKIPTSPASASAVNTAVYLLYAAIALIIVTLALAAVLLVRSGGRGGQGGHPAKAYEGPSSSSSTPPSSGGSGGGSTGGA